MRMQKGMMFGTPGPKPRILEPVSPKSGVSKFWVNVSHNKLKGTSARSRGTKSVGLIFLASALVTQPHNH